MSLRGARRAMWLSINGLLRFARNDGGVAGLPPLEGVASNEVRARGRLSPPEEIL